MECSGWYAANTVLNIVISGDTETNERTGGGDGRRFVHVRVGYLVSRLGHGVSQASLGFSTVDFVFYIEKVVGRKLDVLM